MSKEEKEIHPNLPATAPTKNNLKRDTPFNSSKNHEDTKVRDQLNEELPEGNGNTTVKIITEEMAAEAKKILFENERPVDLETYLKLYKEIVVPKDKINYKVKDEKKHEHDFTPEQKNPWIAPGYFYIETIKESDDNNDNFILDIYFIDKENNIAKVRMDSNRARFFVQESNENNKPPAYYLKEKLIELGFFQKLEIHSLRILVKGNIEKPKERKLDI